MSDSPATPDVQQPPQLTPDALVDEFKRQGHFDQIRKQLFQEFQQSAQLAEFKEAAEACMMQYTEKEPDRLVFRDARLRHSDLMRELDRHPLLDQLVEKMGRTNAPKAEGEDEASANTLLGAHGQIAQQIRQQIVQMARPGTDPLSADDTGTPSTEHVE